MLFLKRPHLHSLSFLGALLIAAPTSSSLHAQQPESGYTDEIRGLMATPAIKGANGHAPDEFWINVDAYLAVQRALVLVLVEAGFAGPIS